MNLEDYKKVYFIGIGGIGMSALARLFLDNQIKVSGSDQTDSAILASLKKEGAEIYHEHLAENVTEDFDLVIYTLAIGENNPEFKKAKELNLKTYTYAEMLGQVSKDLKTIAIAGTHGKTTTTAMTYFAMKEAGESPHTIVGSLINDEKGKHTNYFRGESASATQNYFLVEACEYKKSFLNLNPEIIIITNLEEDHLDFYKDLKDIQNTFREFALKLKPENILICDTTDPNLLPVIENLDCRVINYRDYLNTVPKLKVIGEHNIKNASCVLALIDALSLDMEKSKLGLQKFNGTWRRSEFIKETANHNLIFDDYAHHPSEISATLSAFKKEYQDKKIIAIFQPHLYSRTKIFFDKFVEVLQIADEILLLPIYAAREEDDGSINSAQISEALNKIAPKNASQIDPTSTSQITPKSSNFTDTKDLLAYLKEKDAQETNQIFITIGAGDLNKIWEDTF